MRVSNATYFLISEETLIEKAPDFHKALTENKECNLLESDKNYLVVRSKRYPVNITNTIQDTEYSNPMSLLNELSISELKVPSTYPAENIKLSDFDL